MHCQENSYVMLRRGSLLETWYWCKIEKWTKSFLAQLTFSGVSNRDVQGSKTPSPNHWIIKKREMLVVNGRQVWFIQVNQSTHKWHPHSTICYRKSPLLHQGNHKHKTTCMIDNQSTNHVRAHQSINNRRTCT